MVQSGRARSSTGLGSLGRQTGIAPFLFPGTRLPLCTRELALGPSPASAEVHRRRNAAAHDTNFPVRRYPSEETGGTMRIAQISPLMEAVPPKFYGGTERIVAYLTDALVGLGHEVTLFASGDSSTAARLVAACPWALRLDPTIRDHVAPLIAMLETAAQRAGEFDVVHLHCDYLAYVALRRAGVPV